MTMAMSYSEISRLSKEELIERYDQTASNTVIGLEFLKQEIWRRDSDRLSESMVKMTKRIQWLTIAITILTVLNVVVVVVGTAEGF
ncbi:MAG: hypothetical protein F4132_00290 [Gemmatimonadetes bacterium]|nr:hypothetical protein [Gemmatimonadota bacterium]MYH17536.1 hypothetical protein [Gemmatimonadota bacterium]